MPSIYKILKKRGREDAAALFEVYVRQLEVRTKQMDCDELPDDVFNRFDAWLGLHITEGQLTLYADGFSEEKISCWSEALLNEWTVQSRQYKQRCLEQAHV